MTVAPRMIRLLTGGPIEDAARALYDRIPEFRTLYEGSPEDRSGRLWFTRSDYAGASWFGATLDKRCLRVGVLVVEFAVRW